VICEIMKDDGTMARLPDLIEFAREHDLKIGTIADLIHYRSRTESIIERVGERDMQTPWGTFHSVLYRDKPSGRAHVALVKGKPQPDRETLVRVHEPCRCSTCWKPATPPIRGACPPRWKCCMAPNKA
jgi:3,4-dihydroxy 2-butanone 4-phosphate synthase/GTP cyclohydrolase II